MKTKIIILFLFFTISLARSQTISNIEQILPHSYTNSLGQSNTYYGDNLFVAFQKANGNFYFLGVLSSNNAANLTVVSNFLNSVSNLTSLSIITNGAAGNGYIPMTSNTISGGYKWVAISSSSSGGVASNAIANNNGLGTNISLFLLTWLASSNLAIYPLLESSGNSGLIPTMTSATTPFGTVTASSFVTGFDPYKGFTTSSSWESASEADPYIEYQFPMPVSVNGMTMIISSGGPTNRFAYSNDGATWTPVWYEGFFNNGTTINFAPVFARYFRWDFPMVPNNNVLITSINLFGYGGSVNVTSSIPISLISPIFNFNTNNAVTSDTNGFGTPNFYVSGVGPQGGQLLFGGGDTIYDQSKTDFQGANDNGLTLGYHNGQILGEIGSFVAGTSNDIAGSRGAQIDYASIVGGLHNVIGDNSGDGSFSFIGGGYSNIIIGASSSIIGSSNSVTGPATNSLALGMDNVVTHNGVLMWNDNASGMQADTVSNQIVFHSLNGFVLNGGPFFGTWNTIQPTAANFKWYLVPVYNATITNFYIGPWTNGSYVAIWSNTSSSYVMKQIAP